MKVVIKPGGIVLVLAIIVGIIVQVTRNTTPPAVSRSLEIKPLANGTLGNVATTVASSGELLGNVGFEGGYVKYDRVFANKDIDISGATTRSWSDNSDWGTVSVRYDKDDANPHSGYSAQKITLRKVGTSYAQFVQYLDLPVGTKLEGTIWARSDTPLEEGDAGIRLRESGFSKTLLGETGMLLTPKWQRFTVRGTVTNTEGTAFIVYVNRAGVSVWVDDASLRIVK